MSLRLRLTLWNVFVLAISLILSGVTIHFIVEADQIRRLDDDLEFEVLRYANVSSALHDSSRSTDAQLNDALSRLHSAIRDVGEETGNALSPFVVRAFTPAGRSFLSDRQGPDGRFVPYDKASLTAALTSGRSDYRDITYNSQPYRLLSYPVMREDSALLVLQTIKPTRILRQTIVHLDSVMVHLIPFALLIALAGGAFLTGRSLKPLAKMAATAETIRADNLSERLPAEGKDELGRLAKVFNRMLGRLETSFETQSRFVADASHELRTPLTALKANTSLALSRAGSPEEYRAALQSADTAADRMARLVNDLLFLSRSDAGQLEASCVPVELDPVVDAVLDLFGAQPDVQVSSEVLKGLVVVGDEDYVRRLLVNLISNAVRHTQAGGKVTVSAALSSEQVEIVVADTGSGIPPDHLPHIFDRFYRVDAARSRTDGGSGLGLAICRSMVQAMGGTIEVNSDVGVGTTVRVRLKAS